MSEQVHVPLKPTTTPARHLTPVPFGVLQRKCACGGSAGECEECRKKRMTLQRHPASHAEPATVPAIVHDVLRSPGQPLDAGTRAFFEPRFGHDFSKVRVHTDAKAVESARAVNALAYTVGNQIAFSAGRYAPRTLEGRKLLAHELIHSIQQTQPGPQVAYASERDAEQEAKRKSTVVVADPRARTRVKSAATGIQKASDNPLDEKAKRIIQAAKDPSKPIAQRAIDVVNNIVRTYYDPNLVEKVVYDEKDPGLTTSPVGRGRNIKGEITVGKYFIENIDFFARRVLQVGHELQHVQQERSGMGGPAKKNEREFLAFHWEATQPEKAGTGRMPHATRVSLIDAALRNYYCMPAANQKKYVDKKAELLRLRGSEERASGRGHTEPPKGCPRR